MVGFGGTDKRRAVSGGQGGREMERGSLGRNVRVEMEGRSDASRRRAKEEKILPVESAPRLEGVEGSGNWESTTWLVMRQAGQARRGGLGIKLGGRGCEGAEDCLNPLDGGLRRSRSAGVWLACDRGSDFATDNGTKTTRHLGEMEGRERHWAGKFDVRRRKQQQQQRGWR